MVLAGAAVAIVNEAGQFGLSNVRNQAREMLQEVVELDTSNQHAMTNLLILQNL